MNYFQGILRGAHLLAHTWAIIPRAQGCLFRCPGIKCPLSQMFSGIIPRKVGEVDRELLYTKICNIGFRNAQRNAPKRPLQIKQSEIFGFCLRDRREAPDLYQSEKTEPDLRPLRPPSAASSPARGAFGTVLSITTARSVCSGLCKG